MKGEIFPRQNKDKLNEIQVQSGCRLGPVFLKRLKHQYLSDTANATWLHKRSLFRNPRKTKWDSKREEKGVILRGLVRQGLCASSYMMEAKWSWELSEEMLSRIRKWSWQKKNHMSLKHLASRTQWHFQRKTEFGGGCPEVSISSESGPHTCSLYCPTV